MDGSTPFNSFYATLRLLTGDNDPYGVYDNQDGQLDGALRSVIALGLGPAPYQLQGDMVSGTAFQPAVPNGNDFALITYEAALLLIGGGDGMSSSSYRTRAISVSRSGNQSQTLLADLKVRIHKIRNGSDEFSSIESFYTWINSVAGPLGAASISPNALPSIGVKIPDIVTGL